MALMMGNDPLMLELVKLLKLPARTKSFRLSAGVGEAVTVECTFFPERPDRIGALQEVTTKYQVQLVEQEPASARAAVDVMS